MGWWPVGRAKEEGEEDALMTKKEENVERKNGKELIWRKEVRRGQERRYTRR